MDEIRSAAGASSARTFPASVARDSRLYWLYQGSTIRMIVAHVQEQAASDASTGFGSLQDAGSSCHICQDTTAVSETLGSACGNRGHSSP